MRTSIREERLIVISDRYTEAEAAKSDIERIVRDWCAWRDAGGSTVPSK